MKILLEGIDGTLANFDNVFDIHSVKLTDGFCVRARCASFYQGCYEVVTLFKGTKEEADQWMRDFKNAIVNARDSVCIFSVPKKVKPVPDFDGEEFLKTVPLSTACDIEIYNVLADESWEQIRTNAIKSYESLPATLEQEVRKRVLPVHVRALLKYPTSKFYSCYSTAIHRMATVQQIYKRHGVFRLTEDAFNKMDHHIGIDVVDKYNAAVKTYI